MGHLLGSGGGTGTGIELLYLFAILLLSHTLGSVVGAEGPHPSAILLLNCRHYLHIVYVYIFPCMGHSCSSGTGAE